LNGNELLRYSCNYVVAAGCREDLRMSSEYSIKTVLGIFDVEILETPEKTITVSDESLCISISIQNDCASLECEDRSEKTVAMVHLAFTILREVAPHIKYVLLDDRSDFECDIGDGRFIGISIALYELIFHRATWYERHFGAKLLDPDDQTKYQRSKQNFEDPSYKPAYFNFKHNPEINALLKPIYNESRTWSEFFKSIYPLNGICKILFPWYIDAVRTIMKTTFYERTAWVIDLSDTSKNPIIEYELPNNKQNNQNNKNKTRKMKRRRISKGGERNTEEYDVRDMANDLSYEDIYNIRLPPM
jgi:hypothetical protein